MSIETDSDSSESSDDSWKFSRHGLTDSFTSMESSANPFHMAATSLIDAPSGGRTRTLLTSQSRSPVAGSSSKSSTQPGIESRPVSQVASQLSAQGTPSAKVPRSAVESHEATTIENILGHILSPEKSACSQISFDGALTPLTFSPRRKKAITPTLTPSTAAKSPHYNGSLFEQMTRTDLLRHFIIEHDNRVQKMMDDHQIALGVQYSIAIGVQSKWCDWEDITEEHIAQLAGSNVVAGPKVEDVLRGRDARAKKHMDLSILWVVTMFIVFILT